MLIQYVYSTAFTFAEIYTPKVLSSKSLEIESTEDLVISSNTTNIKALTGGVNIQAIENIRLQSLTGQVRCPCTHVSV